MDRIFFLHIGKTAGTQIKQLCTQINDTQSDFKVVKCGHTKDLKDLDRGAKYFFSIRHPVARFTSGFYSRKRKGQPLRFVEWNRDEALAFKAFMHANDLAEALFRDDARGRLAFSAIQAIRHTAKNQMDWFSGRGFFLQKTPPLGIIRQEHFDTDWAALMGTIGYDKPLAIAADDRRAHRADYSAVPPLSELARRNLERWYAQDIEFYRHCSTWIEGRR